MKKLPNKKSKYLYNHHFDKHSVAPIFVDKFKKL